jgi:outer membrane protein assembly factor BamE (lipoprotein component of BamABCDE complex)
VRNDLQSSLFPHLRQVFLFVLLWTSAGCLSFSDGAFRQVDGQFFDDRHVTKIIDGSTREQEILEWFGPPISTSISDDNKVLRYHSVRTRRSEVRRFLIRRIYNQKVTQELTIRVSSGVVVDHKYTAQTSEE